MRAALSGLVLKGGNVGVSLSRYMEIKEPLKGCVLTGNVGVSESMYGNKNGSEGACH